MTATMPEERTFSTPMMIQYMEIKKQYPDALLFFRLGDFYELFLEDAKIGAKILGITLTARPRGKDGEIPMAGVPFHSAESYINKLVNAGYKIAMCEQTSEPNKKGIVDREVVRIITPGTITNESSLNHKHHNFLMSLSQNKNIIGVSLIELTTGDIFVDQWDHSTDPDQLPSVISRFQPAELIHPPELSSPIKQNILNPYSKNFPLDDWSKYARSYRKSLKSQLGVSSFKSIGIQDHNQSLKATNVALNYLVHTQKQPINHLKEIHVLSHQNTLRLDSSTITNLELFETLREKDTHGSLVAVLDHTQTAMGARQLRLWIKHPLKDKQNILNRQESVSYFTNRPSFREEIKDTLAKISDLERLTSKLNLGLSNPKDLLRLRDTLSEVTNLKTQISHHHTKLFEQISNQIHLDIQEIIEVISKQLKDTVPVDPQKGNFITKGIDPKLDALNHTIKTSKQWIAKSQETERQRTGITSLKIKFNKVFGYYIEISRANLTNVPDDYERKQTLVNAERFITPELKHHEAIILSNETKAHKLEHQLYLDLVEKIKSHTQSLQKSAEAIAKLDCLLSLAIAAETYSYNKPRINEKGILTLKDSRHPVVEITMTKTQFVPNDCYLDPKTHQLIVLTGPNMAGKSVYMRQIALITLMAHIGSFVPAKKANIPIVDRIFVRSGAADIITKGMSTFMVEMVETAQILNKATSDSLIVMDEIGRGTSTFDGISIAWAIAEYIVNTIGAKTLFATHYHELQKLEMEHPNKIKNFHAAIDNHNNEPVFIHRILEGPAEHSFGIAVAKQAGVPKQVAQNAQTILKTLENTANVSQPKPTDYQPTLPLDNPDIELVDKIKKIDISNTTPLEALNLLSDIKKQL